MKLPHLFASRDPPTLRVEILAQDPQALAPDLVQPLAATLAEDGGKLGGNNSPRLALHPLEQALRARTASMHIHLRAPGPRACGGRPASPAPA